MSWANVKEAKDGGGGRNGLSSVGKNVWVEAPPFPYFLRTNFIPLDGNRQERLRNQGEGSKIVHSSASACIINSGMKAVTVV